MIIDSFYERLLVKSAELEKDKKKSPAVIDNPGTNMNWQTGTSISWQTGTSISWRKTKLASAGKTSTSISWWKQN